MLWLMNSFLPWEGKRLTICQSKRKKVMGFFPSLSLLFSLSFLGCIWYLFFNFEFEVLFPVTNLLYWNLEHKINIFKQKMMYREKKNQKEKALHYVTVFTGESVKITSFLKKTFGAWFFPSITEHSSLRLVELSRVMLAEKLNLKIFFADKGTLTSSTWRLVSCDCMLLERSN